MKILYGAGNLYGANSRLSRFLQHNKTHDIKIATYYKNHHLLHHIDWTLDACRSRYNTEFLVEDVCRWLPDLIISDYDNITAKIAERLDIELWTCSPMHLLNGIDWDSWMKWPSKLIPFRVPAVRKFIYSPFGDIQFRPLLKDGFEWVSPYNKTSNSKIIKGSTCEIADLLYDNKSIYISPDLLDPECILNAHICEYLGIGINIGDMSRSIKYSRSRLEIEVSAVKTRKVLNEKLHEKIGI